MARIRHFLALAALVLATGCQGPATSTRIENVQREARYYEDQLYWYHYENRKLCQENQRLKKRVDRLQDQAKERNRADDIPPSLFRSGRGDVAPEAPRETIDPTPPSSSDPPPKPKPIPKKPEPTDEPPNDDDDDLQPPAVGGRTKPQPDVDDEPPEMEEEPPARPGRARPFEDDEPPAELDETNANDGAEVEEMPPPRVRRPGKGPAPSEDEARRSRRPVRSIQLTASGSRGVEIDGRPGDDAVEIVVEPLDREGRPVVGQGEIVVTLTDPAAVGAAARLGSKTFSPQELASLAGLHPRSRGFLLGVPFDHGSVARERVRASVVFLAEDGAELEAQGDVLVRPATSRREPPSLAGRQVPTKRDDGDDQWTSRPERRSRDERISPASTHSPSRRQPQEPTPAELPEATPSEPRPEEAAVASPASHVEAEPAAKPSTPKTSPAKRRPKTPRSNWSPVR